MLALCSDSNGTNAYVTSAQIYGQLVATAWGYSFSNYSVSGHTSNQIAACVNTAIATNPDIIMICAGTNDYSQAVVSGALIHDVIKEICDEVAGMITACKTAGIKPIVLSPILPRTVQQIHQLEGEKALTRVCAKLGADFIPVASHMAELFSYKQESTIATYYTGADWHWTAVGHQMVADLIMSRTHTAGTPPTGPVELLNIVGVTDTSSFARAVTLVGNTFNDSGSARFDGVNDRMTVADSNDWAFGTDNFYISMDVKYNALGGFLVIQRAGSGDYMLFYNDGTKTYFQVVVGSTILLNAQFAWVPSTGVNYSIKIERVGNAFKFYVGGSQVDATVTSSVSIPNYGAVLSIGEDPVSGGGDFNGWINNFKIVRG